MEIKLPYFSKHKSPNSIRVDNSVELSNAGRLSLYALRVVFICLLLISVSLPLAAQTAITTINASTSSSISSTKNVTAPADAVVAVKAYDVTYGTGNLEPLSSFVVGGSTYSNLIGPDTVILQRQFVGDEQLTIFYSRSSFNDVPTPGTIGIETTGVVAADSLYLLSALNAGLTNVLSNVDDVSAGFEVEIERIDYIWFQGIQSSEPTLSAFPIFDLDGNDNVAIAAITSLDANGEPASYGQIVGVGDNVWTGGNISIGDITVFRQETAALDNLPFQNFNGQNVEGMAVTFDDLDIGVSESFYGYSLFAPDVVNGFVSGSTLGAGPHSPAAGITLADISTFPDDTKRSDAGLDLIISASAAASVNDAVIETVGPGGYKDALRTWLKANDGAFVSSGGAVSTEGNSVGFWEDQSVGNYDFTTLGTAPTFRSSTSAINFNPTVDFLTGSDTGLQLGDNADYNVGGPYTRKSINIAFRTSTTMAGNETRQQIFEEGGGTNGLGIYIEDEVLYGGIWQRGQTSSIGSPWNNATPTSFISTGVSADTEHILTLEFDGDGSDNTPPYNGSVTLYLDGQSFGSFSAAGLLYNHGDDIGLGDIDGGSRYHNNTTAASSYQGEISEFIYCNEPASISLSQRQKIESYLAIKYGITLDQSTALNYVNSDGNIIFNTTNPAAIGGYFEYNKDIAGIGRDDASELIQLKSKSENVNSILTIERAGSIGNNNTWLIWGNDGAATAETDLLTTPDTIDLRISRVWRVAETNEVGNTSVTFDLDVLGLTGKSASELSLLVAGNGSGADFSAATVISGGVISGTDITFSGINLADGQYITLGTEYFACSPGGVDTDLYVWLRADIDAFNTGITQANDGQTVATWADQSGFGINAVQDGNAPLFKNNTTDNINFNPTLDFDGVNDRLDLGNLANIKSGAPNGGDYTLMSVGTRQSSGNTQYILGAPGGTGNQDLHFGYRSNTVATIAHWGNDLDVAVSAFNSPGTSPFLLTAEYNGVNRVVEETRNGAFARNSESETVDLQGAKTNYIGDVESLANYNGLISEVIVFDNDVTGLQKQQVYTYLAIKYGITLTEDADNDATNNEVISGSVREGDYVSSDGTTVIWTYANNTTYHNDVAGIGRDDRSCYEQKQSRSQNSGSIVTVGLGTIAADNTSNMNAFNDDKDYLVWGNDGDFADQGNANTSNLPGSVTERMERIWKVEDTGMVGATSISFDLSGLGYSTNVSDFQLIISDTNVGGDFSGATTVPAASYDVGTNTVTFTGVDLTDGQFFTLGTDRDVCAPGGVEAGLLLSLKGDVGTTGTGNVTAWADQSTNSFSATATTGPERLSNGINFNPSLQFNGTNEEMVISGGILGTSSPNDLVVFAVTEVNTVQSSWLFFEPLASSGRFSAHLPWSDGNAYYDYPNATEGNGRISEAWGSSTGTPHLWTLFSSTSTLATASGNANKAILRDGTVLDTNTSSITGTGINGNFNIASGGGSAFYAANISEILIYNSAPNEQELEQIQTYFAIKYGIFKNSTDIGSTLTVDESDYFDANATVIWDRSSNSDYHQDVAGIGRDDASCLNQKQSSSEASDDILTVGLGAIAADNASNANSFADDGDYFVWGNDNEATAEGSKNTVHVPGNVSERMARVWRAQNTGDVSNLELQFDLTGTGFSTSDATRYSLLVSNEPTMASASVVVGGSFNGDVLSFTGVNIANGQYFTIGSDFETCGPGGVNVGIALWLAADKETFSDAGTTPAVNLSSLQQWNDQSAPPNNATETNLGGAGPVLPVYRTEEFNFNPVIRFSDPNSSNASFVKNTTNDVTGDFTLISVFKTGQSDGTANDFVNSPALIGADTTAFSTDYGLGIENGNIFIKANTTTGFDAETTTSYNDDEIHFALATRVQSSGAVSIFVDSESAASGTGTTGAISTPANFGIGNHGDPNINAQFSGDIAETIVFSKSLDENERTRVESYLAIKYGITRVVTGLSEAAEDYLAGDGGIIWDIDGQGVTYHNDIFGIGRDDLSCFEQIKSKSENADALVTFDNNGAFASDDAWLISGNDNAPIEQVGNNEKPSGIKSRLNREWKVQETGTVGNVRLSYDLSTVTGPSGIGTNNLNQTRLMVDDDGNFGNGGTTLISPISIDGTNDIVTFEVNFTDGQYYTLGSIEIAALPITLISFEAKVYNQDQVKIEWTTASEENNAFYTVERSTNGIDFEAVSSIDGAGNSNNLLFYSYVDINPITGLSFYRLKQTDFSGEFDFSEIRSVKIESQFKASYKAYPNPINKGDKLKISYNVEGDQTLYLTILNTRWQVILRDEKYARLREEFIEISTSQMEKGLNLIRIIDKSNKVVTLKVLVR